ncbi:MAG: single-stranded-DNA-specific exonuclease RecJ [Candidatus Thermoplasmatota archaeon]|nr:single-stranded-DNA-specific exonuclease RecJ [Candidatus Thermoplasmatota archaeon]
MNGPIRQWRYASEDIGLADRISRELEIPVLISRLLVARGMRDAAVVHDYLHPDLRQLHDPFLMDGMKAAVNRVKEAIEGNEVVGVHGDYDTDGITATALMLTALGEMIPREKMIYKLPSRYDEGYGISEDAVRALAQGGATLLISVDCGVQAMDAVDLARTLGMDVIVTDHHEMGTELPKALSVLDPKVKGSGYPFKGLSGVGVAFKLVHALNLSDVLTRDIRDHLHLVALGTIADIVPLTDENRPLVREGLEVLSATDSPGILALRRETGLDPGRGISSTDVSHRLAPRLNAAGRLGNPEMALELLLTGDRVDADVFSRELSTLNFRRQAIAARVMEEALEMARSTGALTRSSIVVAKEGWNPGVLGITASRMLEETGKPSVVLTTEGGTARGSARAPSGFDLLAALEHCKGSLDRWGGHDRAAGLTMGAASIASFKDGLDAYISERYPDGLPPPVIEIDLDLAPSELGIRSIVSLELMQPTGFGNPASSISIRDALVGPRVQAVGGGKHLKFDIDGGDGHINCIWFNSGHLARNVLPGSTISICGSPDINRWGGNDEVQIRIMDIKGLDIRPI